MGATFSDRPSATGPRYVFSAAVTCAGGTAGQGGSVPVDDAVGRGSKVAKPRKKKTAVAASSASVEGWKLYLSDDVRFRIRMLAFQRGKKISTVANEILDRNLPRWTLERTE
jgi:hypothetical protein